MTKIIPSHVSEKPTDLVIGNIIEHLLDLRGVFHWGGYWVRGAQRIYLHCLETLAQEEVILR